MRALLNDCLRQLIAWTIRVVGVIGSGRQVLCIVTFRWNQERLKRKYRIRPNTPVLSYGTEVERSIRNAARECGPNARFAMTSGSTGKPKEILYTPWRLLALKFAFSDMFARACYAFRIRRTSLYVFTSFETDTSLTSLLLDETEWPNYLSTLQAPYRVQQHPAIRALVQEYGAAAVRLWLLTVSNPGVLYSTNPSTLSTFLDELALDSARSSRLIKDWWNNPACFDPAVHKMFRRLESSGCAKRLKQIALSDGPVSLAICAPAVNTYICWTGGYVQPFLDRLATHLPSPRYTLPMYSMSTETIETLSYFRRDDIAFLPIAPKVVYEFLDEAGNLLDVDQLEPGQVYEMVISDAYGLRRYRTDDLFVCKRKIRNLPDLTFLRRRTLEYSFTGEKLTALQLSAVFEQLRARYPALLAGQILTCLPSQPPHYKVLLIGDPRNTHNDVLAACCDALLSEINCEYKSKRTSGRLGPIEVVSIRLKDFLAMNPRWETQYKFLPLIRVPVS